MTPKLQAKIDELAQQYEKENSSGVWFIPESGHYKAGAAAMCAELEPLMKAASDAHWFIEHGQFKLALDTLAKYKDMMGEG